MAVVAPADGMAVGVPADGIAVEAPADSVAMAVPADGVERGARAVGDCGVWRSPWRAEHTELWDRGGRCR